MTTGQIAVIVNPKAQNGALGKNWPEINATLQRVVGEVRPYMTNGPGHATELSRTALLAGYSTVIAIGGDGTIGEVASGFFDGNQSLRPDAALGIIPFGTGGDFRRTLGLEKNTQASAEIIARGRKQAIDVGLLDFTSHSGESRQRIFANIASFGVSGLVDEIVNQSSKMLGGKMSFLLASLRATLRYQNQRVRLTFDGDEKNAKEATLHVVAVANGKYFGGGMKIAPDAEPTDGLFDVVALGDMSVGELLLHGRKVYSGGHLRLPKTWHTRAKVVRAEPVNPSDNIRLDVDGEAPGRLPATFSILERALQVYVP